MVSVGGALYSVPSELVDERVWARVDGSELVIVHADGPQGPREVARHELTTPGRPSIREEHYPPRPAAGGLGHERQPAAAAPISALLSRPATGRERIEEGRGGWSSFLPATFEQLKPDHLAHVLVGQVAPQVDEGRPRITQAGPRACCSAIGT